jgi:hypothetical protein
MKMQEIRLYIKGEFEDWEKAIERKFHGVELNNRELKEFIERLLKKTEYATYAVTKIYKTVEAGFVIVLFTQTNNQYGGYVGSIQTYITIDDIVRSLKRLK